MSWFRSGTLDGSVLKRLAIGSMLCDHLAFFLLLPLLDRGILPLSRLWIPLYWLGRVIGRISFPLFCLLLTEGFSHTQSRPRYAARMLFFALVSELPFNLAYSGNPSDPAHQNVFFTLLLGLCLLTLLQQARHWIPAVLALFGCSVAAWLLRCDYDVVGILLIASLWLLREQPTARIAATAPILAISSSNFGGTALLALIPIGLSSGKRGEEPHPLCFYWFYPAHLLAIFLLRQIW